MDSDKDENKTPPTINCFLIDGPVGDLLLCALTERFIVLDSYNELKTVMLYNDNSILTGFNKRKNLNLCCVSGFAKDGKDFLLSFTNGDKLVGMRRRPTLLQMAIARDLKKRLSGDENELNLYKKNYHKKELSVMEGTTNLVVRFELILEEDGSYRLALSAGKS